MQIGLLNHYLEHQAIESGAKNAADMVDKNDPAGQGQNRTSEASVTTDNRLNQTANGSLSDAYGDYQPSQKTLLLTAVAEDFNVSDLALTRVDDLERRLQEFDLLTPITRNAMQMLHRLRGDHSDIPLTSDQTDPSSAHINAVNVLKYKQQQLQQQGADLYQQRQVTELVRLFSNLESAHSALAKPVSSLDRQPLITA